MKKCFFIIVFLFGLFLLSNCSNSSQKENSSISNSSVQEGNIIKNGNNFIGKWCTTERSNYIPFEISRNGDAYILNNGHQKIAFRLSDGVLIGDMNDGNIIYGSENDHIYYGNEEWSRVK